MAVCSVCKQELPIGRVMTMCTKCTYKYNRQRAEKYRQGEYKKLLVDSGCVCCGLNNPNALEVHHLSKDVKRFGRRSQSLFYNQHDLEANLAVVLCANCHLMFHSFFGGRNRDFPPQTKESTIMIINQVRQEVYHRG